MRFLLLLLVATSCASVYMPNTRNTPMFRESGEAQLSVYAAAGLDFQGAYAVTDHIAIMGNYNWLSANQTVADSTFKQKNNLWEVGLGLYGVKRKIRWELFAGYGMGKVDSYSQLGGLFYSDFGQQEVISTGNYTKIFIQPSLGSNKKKVNVAFTPRISLIEFKDFTAAGITRTSTEKMQIFIEPAFTTKFLLSGNLEAMIQIGITTSTKAEVYYEYERFQASAGLHLYIANRLRTRVY